MYSIVRVQLVLCLLAVIIADEAYFPVKTKNEEEGVTAFEAKWFSKPLERMNEPHLPEAAKDSKAIVYRLMILPTWGNPIVVRVQKQQTIYSLSARRLDGQGGYDPGKLVEQRDIQLSEQDSKTLESLIESLKFFEMPTEDKIFGADGDESILEGVSGGKYHVVDRWCATSYEPQKRGLTNFLELYKFLIDKAALSQGPQDKGHKLLQ
jgi:hypothetical protein